MPITIGNMAVCNNLLRQKLVCENEEMYSDWFKALLITFTSIKVNFDIIQTSLAEGLI